MYKILLVEDDIALSYGVEYALKQEGFLVSVAKNLKEAEDSLKDQIDLILLDVMLTDGNGYDFCVKVRRNSDIPIIFMTALEEEANIVLGLDLGGDDYLTKPVRIKELVSRINAVLRRRKKESELNYTKVITSNKLTINPLTCKVHIDNCEVSLTSIEYKLLLFLIKNKGIVLSRETILNNLWDSQGSFVEGNTLNVYIKRLREKIEDDPASPKLIQTVRGLGYMWEEEVRGLELIWE